MDIGVGPWCPDVPDFENQGSTEALNVIPAGTSYRPFPGFGSFTNALTARAQGGVFAKRSDGGGKMFAGDATKLYSLDLAAWSDVTRVSGGAYACPSDGHWNFCLFGPHVLAFNGADAPQTFNIDSASNFSALGGSPPTATYAAPVGDFVVAANTATNRSRVYWSGINDSTTWTPSQATQSHFLPDGGEITGIVGYSLSGVVFQRRAIRVMSYIGTPLVFQFQKISDGVGATIPGSVASYRDYIFFWDSTGFYMLVGAAQIVPIGDQRVNRYFWNRLNKNFLHRVTAAVDPVNGLYVVSYPSSNSADGTPDSMLVYRWAADRWARSEPGALEMVFGTANQHSFTLEELDGVSPTLEGLPYSLDSDVWIGVGQPLLGAFSTAHKFGFFAGPNMAATVDTTEADISRGSYTRIRGARPMVDGAIVTPSLSIGHRNRQGDAVAYTAAVAMNGLGTCPFNVSARYHRGRVTVPAGADWTHIQGIDHIDARREGHQ